jgi:hypothetical protein
MVSDNIFDLPVLCFLGFDDKFRHGYYSSLPEGITGGNSLFFAFWSSSVFAFR